MSKNDIVKLLDRQSAIDAINKLGEKDLKMLNGLIVERFNRLKHEKTNKILDKFFVGDQVQFTAPDGELKTGHVLRVNQKTLSIDTGDGCGWWKISPGLVKLLKSEGI